MADKPQPPAAPVPSFGRVARKGKRKGTKRRRSEDEEEDTVAVGSIQDIREEQKARVRRRGVEGSGHAAAKAAAEEATKASAAASSDTKEAGDSVLQGVSAAALAHVEERAAKMDTLLAGGFRVEAARKVDLAAEDNPVMMQYVAKRLAEMRGEEEGQEPSPTKPPVKQDAMYALTGSAAEAVAAARAGKPTAPAHAGPLYMNMGLAEVALPQRYMDANLQATKDAIQQQLDGGRADPLAAPAGGTGSFTSNFAAQAAQYEAASSKHGRVPGDSR